MRAAQIFAHKTARIQIFLISSYIHNSTAIAYKFIIIIIYKLLSKKLVTKIKTKKKSFKYMQYLGLMLNNCVAQIFTKIILQCF